MNDENLYPELVNYIYDYQSRFMTEDEKVAARTAMYLSNGVSDAMLGRMKEKGWISDDEITKQLLADGFAIFKLRLVHRIFAQYKRGLQLNLCPKCNKIARTPLAKQCRFCFHDWH